VVFADKGDLLLLGARTLEGLNLTVDTKRKRLVAAGPLPAASCESSGFCHDEQKMKGREAFLLSPLVLVMGIIAQTN
jgi:hypothetical protein